MSTTWGIIFIIHVEENEIEEQNRIRDEIIEKGLKNEVQQAIISANVKIGLVMSLPEKGQMQDASTSIEYFNLSPNVWSNGKSFGKINIGDGETLTKVLKETKTNLATDKYIIITIDHGMGFGIFDTVPRMKFLSTFEHFLATNDTFKSEFSFERQFEFSVLRDVATEFKVVNDINDFKEDKSADEVIQRKITDMLTSTELSTAIQNVFVTQGKKEVELLAMMNCYMQNIDTAFTLRNAVGFLLASESSLWWEGFDYQGLISGLSANVEEKDIPTIGSFLVSGMPAKYERIKKEDKLKEITLSILNLAHVETVVTEIKNFAEFFIAEDNLYLRLFRGRVLGEDLSKFSEIHLVDLSFLFDCAKKTMAGLTNEEVLKRFEKIYDDFKSAFKNLVVFRNKDFGDDLVNKKDRVRNYAASGCSIIFPERMALRNKNYYYLLFYIKSTSKNEFATFTNWGSFIDKYLNDVEKTAFIQP